MKSQFQHASRQFADAWWQAYGREGRAWAPLSTKRLATLNILYPGFLGLQAFHWAGFLADHYLLPAPSGELKDPLFILGVPRSATTFVHRSLAEDSQFTSLSTWEAILAPSLSQRRLLRNLGRWDQKLNSPLRRLLDATSQRVLNDFNDIHPTDLFSAEEDYLALLPFAACFILSLAYPQQEAFWDLAYLNRRPELQTRLMQAYKAVLGKHMQDQAPGRRLLSKNAAFASWAGSLMQAFPSARFLVCIREPRGALSSQLSAIEPGRQLFALGRDDSALQQRFADLYANAYAHLREVCAAHPHRVAVLDAGDLKQNCQARMNLALKHLQIPVSEQTRKILKAADAESARHRSAHHHARDVQHLVSTTMQADYTALREQAQSL